MDFGLMLAATTPEPAFASILFWKVLAWVGVAAGLTFVIFVHELGHFLVAKACGVKCEKFYVGFDFFEFGIPFTNWKIPRSLIKFQWGETEYGLGSLPLGGYVKMLGQDDDPRNAEAEAARIRAAAAEAPRFGAELSTPLTNEALAAADRVGESAAAEAPVKAQTTDGHTILLDPRSYPAKPVPARMAIISAGVTMNVIFAVVLAAVAYCLGPEEMPAIVGGTSPGGAAWVEGIQPGSKIVRIGKSGESHEFLRFGDIKIAAVLNGGQDVSLLVRQPNGEPVEHELRPTRVAGSKQPLIGVAPPHSTKIELFPEAFTQLNPTANPPLADHDRVLEAAGQKVASGADLNAILAQQPLGPITLKVERRERTSAGELVKKSTRPPEVIETTVEPRPMRELGIDMKLGPVVAVRKVSPAAEAGLQADDLIVEVNGEPVGNPLSLSQRLTPTSSNAAPVTLAVDHKDRRGQTTRKTLTITPEPPLQSPLQMPTNPTAIESLGIAFPVTNEVAAVDPDGPAAAIGIQAGDIVESLEFLWRDTELGRNKQHAAQLETLLPKKPMQLAPGKASWPGAMAVLQGTPEGTRVKLTWQRDGQAMTGELTPRQSATFFNDSRAISLYSEHGPHQAQSWGEAFSLGLRETGHQLTQVLRILQRLATGGLSATNLSGPLGIVSVAAAFASQGVPDLLLFLTALSANLAVLNFLPIPALDGGHMLFLTAEAIRGKPVDERLQVRLTVAGVICLLSLLAFATVMDIQRWFS